MKLSVLVEDEAVVVLLRPARYSYERHTKKNEGKGRVNPTKKKKHDVVPFRPLVEDDDPWHDPCSLAPIKSTTRRDKYPQQERRLRPWWNIEDPPPTTKQHLPRSKTAAKQQPGSEDPFVFLTIPDILFQNAQIATTIRGSSNHNHNSTAIQPKPTQGTTSQDDDSTSASTTTESSSSSCSDSSVGSSSTNMVDLSSTGNTTADTTLLLSESFDSESFMEEEISSSTSHHSHDDNTTFHLDLCTACPPSSKSKVLLGDPNCGSSNATTATTTSSGSGSKSSDESTTETSTAQEEDSSDDCSDNGDDDDDDESTSTTSDEEEDSSREAFVPQYQWLKLKRQLKVTPKQVHFARTVYIHEVPRVLAQDWDQVFWDANELAEFRHAAFLHDCGLHQEEEVGQYQEG